MARVPAVHEALSALVGVAPFYAAAGSSQVISNVPAAVLLSGFTNDWTVLIVGTNLGGLGTPHCFYGKPYLAQDCHCLGLGGKASLLGGIHVLECGVPCCPVCGKCGIRMGLSLKAAVFADLAFSKALLPHARLFSAK